MSRYILEDMDHPFIVKLHYAFQNSLKTLLACGLVWRRTVLSFVEKTQKFPEDVVKFYVAEILLAIEYHSVIKGTY